MTKTPHNHMLDLCILYAERPYDTKIVRDAMPKGITSNVGKRVFAHIYENDGDPEEYVASENLWMITDPREVCETVFSVCAGFDTKFWQTVGKKPNAIGRVTGAVMTKTRGCIEASLIESLAFYWHGRYAV
jgi:Asp-tRNA(Asn)/Glu-tRNA(Gln) amidotransferase B subunit